MIAFDEVLIRHRDLERRDLTRWVENRWVLPERSAETWVFHEVDVARVELIIGIRRDFAIDDEAMGLVLALLDQVYGMRRQMRRLCDAVAGQPQDVQDAIRRALIKRTD
jgi:chaperone modulatory protein CbpM